MLHEERFRIIGVVLWLLSYAIASIAIISENIHNQVHIVILLILGLSAVSIIRTGYFSKRNWGSPGNKVSLAVELSLIAAISSFNGNGTFFLFFAVTITMEAFMGTTRHAVITTLIAMGIAISHSYYIDPGFNRILDGILSSSVSFLFTFAMAFLAKTQLNEKLKIARVNMELEQAYKVLLENAPKIQQLAIEQERTRMAREIHDTLAHTLTAAIIQMEAGKKLMNVNVDRARQEIEKAQEITREGLNEVKRTIKALRPQVLDNNSFFEAVLNMAADIKGTAGIEVELKKGVHENFKLPLNLEVALYRVIQESITNAVRHGTANKVTISVEVDDTRLYVDIHDNGRGTAVIKKGFGLKGITERIEMFHGRVDFTSTPGDGFKTRIRIPLGGEAYGEN